MKLTQFITAAAIAVFAPLMASASTVMVDGGNYNLSDDTNFTYGADHNTLSSGQMLSFNFTNDLGGMVELLATTTTNGNGSASGGFGAQDDALGGIDHFSTLMANQAQITFFVRLGDVNDPYDLDIWVRHTAEVPIPAAGFLLIGALGGLAALRRRKA
ncbi:MAG: VPLPA-CTERM sorting domain-containing protein [Boseongicola sp.]